ncbi:hypothetical protein KY333_02285 [Candidatus Woesearchaeota archaeon]|nr:hypothetical protein [Candidatus Woesearchaeota archaeon]MBW2993790.1 hypothetical protein [Candidatus Woesearchaeota archaeon]
MKKRARAQQSATAASLIGIITIILVFYILFLPPSAREELFAEDNFSETGEIMQKQYLLRAPIGRMDYVGDTEFDHYMPNLYLHESKKAEILANINSFTIQKTLYKTDRKEHTFGIADPANTQNVFLSFAAPLRKGILKIKFNDYDIFEGEVRQNNPPPITINNNYLKEKNTLVFYLEGFGMPARQYELNDIKVVGDVKDMSKLAGKISLPISQEEYNNFERAWMDFYPLCDQFKVGVMDIYINKRNVFSGVPECDSLNRKDLYKEDLQIGKNEVEIILSSGSASIEQMRIKTMLDTTKSFADYFIVDNKLYTTIIDNLNDVRLTIKFIDDNKLKNARLNINGRLYMIDQRTPTYTVDISDVIEEENNYIELTPLTALNIIKLEITAE